MTSAAIALDPKDGRKLTTIDHIGGIFCHVCHTTFSNKKDYDVHYVHHSLGSKDIVYTCVVCRKEVTGYPSFRNHCYLIHVQKNKFRCEYCSKHYSKQSILKNHIESMHKFKCASCSEMFPSKKDLQTHQIVHKSEKDKIPYPCQACNKPIDNIDVCELHVDEHSSFLYPCLICDETAPTKVKATIHLSTHFDEKLDEELLMDTPEMNEDSSIDILGIHCSYCNGLFKNRLEFDTHFVSEHGDRKLVYSCNICGKQYEKYLLFGDHCYFHISKDRFECTECPKSFSRLSLLIVHTEAFHGGAGARGGAPFKCVRCSRAFHSAGRLRDHLRTEHAEHCVPCHHPGCDNTFSSIKDLILHQRCHKSEDSQHCQQCGLQLTSLLAAKQHLDIHRKKYYSCPVCSRHYREKYLLMKHITPHFEITLHVCKTCGRVFNAKHRLVEHSKIHSAVREHVCSFCGKGFVKPHQLTQHLNIHTGKKPHKCTICPKDFTNYPNLCKHLLRMHNISAKELKQILKTKSENNQITEGNDIKSNDKLMIESGVNSTSSESVGGHTESDESTIDSVGSGWVTTGLAWPEPVVDSGIDSTDMLSVNDATFDTVMLQDPTVTGTEPELAYPREYGPDFGQRGVDADDYCLPHIDPLLTFNQPPHTYVSTPHEQNWEPYITKVYTCDENDFSKLPILNANILF